MITSSPLASAAFEYAPEDAKLRDAFYAGVRWAETTPAPEANARDEVYEQHNYDRPLTVAEQNAIIERCAKVCDGVASSQEANRESCARAGMTGAAAAFNGGYAGAGTAAAAVLDWSEVQRIDVEDEAAKAKRHGKS